MIFLPHRIDDKLRGMLELIRRLEGQNDLTRREILLHELRKKNWNFQLQEYDYAGQEGCNIIADLNAGNHNSLLLVAHYDSFFMSPGANDDASAVAILIDAGEKLRVRPLPANIRIIFFDDEEPSQLWQFPLGSTMYVQKFGVNNLLGVVDLELCGMGDAVGVWPVQGYENRPILKEITGVLQEMQIPFDYGHKVPGFYGDYLPFRQVGFDDAFCLTSFHWKERKKVMGYGDSSYTSLALRYIGWRYFHLPTVPKIFQHYHNPTDQSKYLSETTLQMMSDLVVQIALRLSMSN